MAPQPSTQPPSPTYAPSSQMALWIAVNRLQLDGFPNVADALLEIFNAPQNKSCNARQHFSTTRNTT